MCIHIFLYEYVYIYIERERYVYIMYSMHNNTGSVSDASYAMIS